MQKKIDSDRYICPKKPINKYKKIAMQEEFLHYLWKKGFEKRALVTVAGVQATVVNTGEHNRDAGPDFIHAIVRIGDTTWAGSVEIHVKASDWKRHGHDRDVAYDNVILHAVYEYDTAVMRTNGEEIPTVIMKEYIPTKAYAAYQDFLNNHLWVPCAHEISQVPPGTVQQHLELLSAKRLEKRAHEVWSALKENKGDWNQAFFVSLAGSLGSRINKEPFQLMARKTPLQVILKTRAGMMPLEALLFGQAGFLGQGFHEEYPILLAREYRHQKRKYDLDGIPPYLWKFLRLRPVNFPTIRLAQLAAIYHQCPLPFGLIIDEKDTSQWRGLFAVKASSYWDTHYHFEKGSARSEKWIGQDTIDLLMINTVIPFVYAYGKAMDIGSLPEKALGLLSGTAPESNHIIRTFNTFGLEFQNAAQTQGALEMKKNWCDHRRCLDCHLGHELLKRAL